MSQYQLLSKEAVANKGSLIKLTFGFVAIAIYFLILSKESFSGFYDITENKLRLTKSDNLDKLTPKEEIIDILARPFVSSDHFPWCIREHKYNESIPTGLLFVKVPKTASSTISGVAERVSRSIGAKKFGSEKKCFVKDHHSDRFKYKNRNKAKSFMCGSVRDPTSRSMSRVFFSYVTRGGHEPSDEKIIKWLHGNDEQMGCVSKGQGGFQVNYMSMHNITNGSAWEEIDGKQELNYKGIHRNVKSIMEDYDFIILNERLDESLVAMQILLDLTAGDILYLPSKVSGGYFKQKESCTKMQKSYTSQKVAKYLSSKEWRQEIYGDVLLHAVVNRSLDMTIEKIGYEKFQMAYKKYIDLKHLAEKICAPTAVFPCSPDGNYQYEKSKKNCYYKDWGCGYPCLNELVKNQTRLR